ncbi:hypothetical protein BSKO_00549 [Bryopsis sp. KO-2023]|nr:hypothetical protein BSKO_00549 [Bryopsis sp. KO-2023]
MFMSEDQFNSSSDDSDEDCERASVNDAGRKEYCPNRSGEVSASGVASAPVRPVSATYQRANSARGNAVRMYTNDLYGDEGDILALVDAPAPEERPPPRSPAANQHAKKLQQQRSAAERRRLQRMQGGIAVSNSTMSPKDRPGSARRPFEKTPSRAGGAFEVQAMAESLSPSTSGRDAPEEDATTAVTAPEPRDPESDVASTVEKNLKARGIDTVFDPTGSLDTSPVQSPLAAARPQLTLPENCDDKEKQQFLLTPGPRNNPFLCFIIRDRSESKMYPKYSLYVDEGGQYLLSARKRKKSKSSNYLISLDDEDLARNSEKYFGKVRSNFIGTEFFLYDNGSKPEKQRRGSKDSEKQKRGLGDSDSLDSPTSPSSRLEGARQELGGVIYQHNVLGTRGPRKMTSLLPKVGLNDERIRFEGQETIIDRFKKGQLDQMVVMKNKTPKWNEQLNAYCLNFKGRVTEASVKNFQLVTDDNPEHVILQFGKVGQDTFTMDFMWPICALQAFSLCMTSFDNKFACE